MTRNKVLKTCLLAALLGLTGTAHAEVLGDIAPANTTVFIGGMVDPTLLVEVELDAQGRLLLSQELREFAGIDPKAAVIVAGSFDRVEIWNPGAYSAQIEHGSALIKGAGN